MPNVVWCKSCDTVVWAQDVGWSESDIRGFLNDAGVECPVCDAECNFDGWASHNMTLEEVRDFFQTEDHPIYDWWSALEVIFRFNLKRAHPKAVGNWNANSQWGVRIP